MGDIRGHFVLAYIGDGAFSLLLSVYWGAGAAVSEFLAEQALVMPVLHLGLPDQFIDHGSHNQQLSAAGLDAAGIAQSIEQRLSLLKLPNQATQ